MGIGQIAIVIGSGIIGSLAINSDGNLPDFRDILSFSFKFMKQDKKDGASATNPHTDQLLSQVNHLREQLHLLAHSNQVSIVNVDGRPGPGAYGITALVVGAIGYLYIRWKGWKIADMMFVTKRGLNDACNAVGKQLDQVSENVNASKRHLSGRIDRVDCNLDECQEIIEATGKEVTVIHGDLSAFQQEIQSVHLVVRTLETKLGRLAYTQDHTTRGIHELCEFTKRLDRSPKADTRQIASSTPRPAIESSEAINRTSSAPLGLEAESPAAQSSKTEAPKVLLSSNTISASGLSMLAETSMPPKRGVISRTTSMKEGSSELSSGASSSTMKKPAPSSSRFGFLRGFAS